MNLTVQPVDIQYLHLVWGDVEPFLVPALERSSGEATLDQIKVYLVDGRNELLVVVDENNRIHGALIVQFNNYPNMREAFIVAIGGKFIADRGAWAHFEVWAKSKGASVVRGQAYESVARLWRRAFGFTNRYVVVEKIL
jgi:hypothetical protein